jgi:uncharacterized protein (TIGR02145 family)
MKKRIFILFCLLAGFSAAFSQKRSNITDSRDGNVYIIVKIGKQWWFAENLNFGEMIEPHEKSENNETVEKYCYQNKEENCKKYGGYYQWDEMMGYADKNSEGHIRGICPEGWHIPSDEEWKEMEEYIGVGDSLDAMWWRGERLGKELRPAGKYNFNCVMAGYRNHAGNFNSFDEFANIWTATEVDEEYALYRSTSSLPEWHSIERNQVDKRLGLSVRCVKD